MATVANRYVVPLGPVKMEIFNLTAVTDADTISTLLQNAVFAFGVNTTDTETTSAAFNVSINAATKTLTLNNANFTGSTTAVVLVFGF